MQHQWGFHVSLFLVARRFTLGRRSGRFPGATRGAPAWTACASVLCDLRRLTPDLLSELPQHGLEKIKSREDLRMA
jgi:hypothetical protein